MEESIALGMPDQLAGISDVSGKDPSLEEVEEGYPPVFQCLEWVGRVPTWCTLDVLVS